ncbi:uncharacterized protein LOC113207109 isoform X2 [Frankliniella occidentalis]|uniref:Uncharacterized protein LOC113207109 isoform X2 n=1 Tax=Frankliniella occidentalis TaxID=133901 RepID=A0A6J1SIZ0_FRAOC|nr:uncharacterized protein LOC113207109 isoform X2 [Frankliniella occidentalis]
MTMLYRGEMMRYMLLYLTFTSVGSKRINSFAGPFTVYGTKFGVCDSPPDKPWPSQVYLRPTHFNPAKPNDGQILTGNVTMPEGLNDTRPGHARVDIWSNNQWKKNAFIFNFPGACTALRNNIPNFFAALFDLPSGPSSWNTPCNVKPGTYIVDHKRVFWTYPNVPVFVYGTYRITITATELEKVVICMFGEGTIVPRL